MHIDSYCLGLRTGEGAGRGGWGGTELSHPQPKHFQFASDATVLDKTSLVTSISIQRLDICMASWEKKCNVFKSAFGEWYTIYVLQWDIFYAGSTSAWYYIFRLGVWCRCKDCLVFFGSSVCTCLRTCTSF